MLPSLPGATTTFYLNTGSHGNTAVCSCIWGSMLLPCKHKSMTSKRGSNIKWYLITQRNFFSIVLPPPMAQGCTSVCNDFRHCPGYSVLLIHAAHLLFVHRASNDKRVAFQMKPLSVEPERHRCASIRIRPAMKLVSSAPCTLTEYFRQKWELLSLRYYLLDPLYLRASNILPVTTPPNDQVQAPVQVYSFPRNTQADTEFV